MKNKFVTNIEKTRQEKGFSQDEVAKAIGVSRPTYSNIESGKKELTIGQAEALSSIFQVNIEDILGLPVGTSIFSNVIDSTDKYKQIIMNAIKYGADSRDGKITKTKLAKLVYLIDFTWYYENSKPMSDVQYRKLPRGPVSDVYFRALDEIEDDGLVVREPHGKAIMFSLSESQAPTSKLSNSEVNMIKKICTAWRDRSTEDIVNFTHEQMPWQACFDGEIIPYGLIFQEEKEKVYGPAKI